MSGQPPSSVSPNRTRFSNEDLETVNHLHRTGTYILQLVEGQATAVQARNSKQAEECSFLCKQEMDRYREMSNTVVEMLEARVQAAAALVQGSSSVPDPRSMPQYAVANQNTTLSSLPSDSTSSRMNDGAPTSATYAGHSPAFITTSGAPSQSVSRATGPIWHNNRQPEVTGADERVGGTNVGGDVGSAVESIKANVDTFPVTLRWSLTRGGEPYYTKIQAVNITGDPMKNTWPDPLPLEGYECSLSICELQASIHKAKNRTGKMSTAQFQPAPGTERRQFNRLVKWLREGTGYAAASWKIGGERQNLQVVLRPCEEGDGPGLFVVIFSVSGAPNLQPHHRRSQGPRSQTSSNNDNTSMPPAVSSSSRRAGHSEQAPHSSPYEYQGNMSGYPVRQQQLSPQVHQMQQPQAYPHVQQLHPQAWQTLLQNQPPGQHVETGNTGGGDPNFFYPHSGPPYPSN